MDLLAEEAALSALVFSYVAGIGMTILGVSAAIVSNFLVVAAAVGIVTFLVKKFHG